MSRNIAKQKVSEALSNWRKARNEEFEKAGLDVESVYAKGDFDALPPAALKAVCYVDAYASILSIMEQN